jgi:hypothetical protein
MFMVAEGAKSAPAVMALAEEYDIDMPIARDVYRVYQRRDQRPRRLPRPAAHRRRLRGRTRLSQARINTDRRRSSPGSA